MADMIYRGTLADAVALFSGVAADNEQIATFKRAAAEKEWQRAADATPAVRDAATKAWGDNLKAADEYAAKAAAFRVAAEHIIQTLAFADAAFAAQLRAQLAQLGISAPAPTLQG